MLCSCAIGGAWQGAAAGGAPARACPATPATVPNVGPRLDSVVTNGAPHTVGARTITLLLLRQPAGGGHDQREDCHACRVSTRRCTSSTRNSRTPPSTIGS